MRIESWKTAESEFQSIFICINETRENANFLEWKIFAPAQIDKRGAGKPKNLSIH